MSRYIVTFPYLWESEIIARDTWVKENATGGYTIEVDEGRYSRRKRMGYNELQWIQQPIYRFKNEDDATLFVLTFAGKMVEVPR